MIQLSDTYTHDFYVICCICFTFKGTSIVQSVALCFDDDKITMCICIKYIHLCILVCLPDLPGHSMKVDTRSETIGI